MTECQIVLEVTVADCSTQLENARCPNFSRVRGYSTAAGPKSCS